jgi:REP element-mobilizing transposase RayT
MSNRARPGYRALRRGRASLPGQIYSLTTVTAGRRRIFADLVAGRVVVRAMRVLHCDGLVESLAFVVMPDHLHWLVALGQAPLHKVMQLLKSRTAIDLAAFSRPVWQPGYHDHALRREECVVEWARYIILNPVRAGLVARVGDYPLWDCKWLSGAESREFWRDVGAAAPPTRLRFDVGSARGSDGSRD